MPSVQAPAKQMHAYCKLWTDVWSVGLGAQSVIAMRLARISHGGAKADAECRRMASEKFAAAAAARACRCGRTCRRQRDRHRPRPRPGAGNANGSRKPSPIIAGRADRWCNPGHAPSVAEQLSRTSPMTMRHVLAGITIALIGLTGSGFPPDRELCARTGAEHPACASRGEPASNG